MIIFFLFYGMLIGSISRYYFFIHCFLVFVMILKALKALKAPHTKSFTTRNRSQHEFRYDYIFLFHGMFIGSVSRYYFCIHCFLVF